MPSTVVISGVTAPLDEQLMASIVQLRTGTPSTSTVHAPQDESSHPRLEPVNSSSWRSTSKSNSLGSMASSCRRPFTRSSMSSLFMVPCCKPATALSEPNKRSLNQYRKNTAYSPDYPLLPEAIH